ncbi:MAG: response regulator [Candidatus Sericytochromatia bacterium]
MKAIRFLLVEDDDASRELANTRLSLLGYQVVPCASGEEAIALVAAGQTFDMALMDLRLPGISGAQVIAWLRANGATAEVPILVVSGECDAHQIAGADHAIQKPYHLHELVLAIGRTFERRGRAARVTSA